MISNQGVGTTNIEIRNEKTITVKKYFFENFSANNCLRFQNFLQIREHF